MEKPWDALLYPVRWNVAYLFAVPVLGSIAANKVPGVRAAVCSDTTTARLVKEHNNANIIAFGARIVGIEVAKDIVKTYLDAEFQGGRHEKRIAMIHDIENKR